VEVYGGAQTFGRFLEQRIGATGERELTAGTAAAVGGAVGFSGWNDTDIRAAFTWSPTELQFEEDRGVEDIDTDEDEEGFVDLNAYVFSAEILRFVAGEERRVAPYAVAGVAGALWSLEEGDDGAAREAEVQAGEDESQFRYGTVLGAGLQFRATPRLRLRLEASSFHMGNPFDGDDAFRAATGAAFDEPEWVRMNRFTLNLAYAL
jgi:hypothetical protein